MTNAMSARSDLSPVRKENQQVDFKFQFENFCTRTVQKYLLAQINRSPAEKRDQKKDHRFFWYYAFHRLVESPPPTTTYPHWTKEVY